MGDEGHTRKSSIVPELGMLSGQSVLAWRVRTWLKASQMMLTAFSRHSGLY